jgi:amino acid adenylation domain-containing protein
MDLAVGRSLVQRWRAGVPAPADPDPESVSTAQRGVLLFERLYPGTAVFNLRHVLRHTGHLDEGRFDAALSTLAGRHAALRSSFLDGTDDPRGPVRIVHDPVPLRAHWADLRHLPSHEREVAAREYAERVAAEPFDLSHGPLVRVHGCRLGEAERLLVFVAHHLVCDGGSMRVLLGELDAAYRGELAGTVPGPAPTPADPVALDYWRTRLAGLPALDLPVDGVRPARPTFRAGSVPLDLGEELVTAAERLARAEHATLFMVILAAFQLLLAESSGQDDFAVGAPEAGRARRGQRGVVGLVADLLVLRADLSGRPTFRELVRRARDTSLAAFTHRGVPFEELVAALAPGRHVDGALVQACLAFHGETGEPTLEGSPLEHVRVARPALRYDVDLHLWREPGRLRGSWDYRRETFEAATAERMAQRLPVLLARALAEPDRPVDQLDLLTAEDRELLARWTRGPVTEDPDASLPELFAAQVSRTPDAVAVRDPRRELTYRQLDERSNQLAHYLRDHAVGAGDVVGIRLGRSVDLAVAMLGINKVAAAYVPLDPAYPADRTDYMVRDSSARLVVTEAVLNDLDGRPVSAVDGERIRPDHPAYVLYTSGSTGRPKGVLLAHRNAVPMVRWAQRVFSPADLSRVLASTSVCFDVSVFEFFAPLCAGGTVVVVDNALSLLADAPDVTMVSAVPSAAKALVEAGALPPSVRVVGLGGEAVTGTLVDDLYATGHVRAVVNLYGPTEDTTYSTHALLAPGERPPPIGALLPQERGYVLDRALRRVPVGAVGELYLAGQKLSWGYVNHAGMTAARYVADPFAPVPGERMYRTGDLARYRADGSLLYLGRRDFQVKVRGQRIELGEIETTLQRHPDVREAVVALHTDRLVGYVVARRPAGLDLDDVRAYLRRTLPVVMVPSSLMVLTELPHTPNGKVDRLALPAPEDPAATGTEPPQGPDEALVAEVWRQVLDLDTVGREDDFFDLGGDSLLAGQVLSQLRTRAGASLPLRLVFENSRLADLAAALAAPAAGSAAEPLVARRPPGAEPVLSFDQQRLWLECQLRPGAAYNVHGRRWLRGALDVAALERSIGAIVGRHEALRTTFPFVDGRPVQRVAEPEPRWRIPVAEAGGPQAAARLADAQAEASLDVTSGPLFRCLLVRLSGTEHLLAVTIHHLIADAWSIGLFLRELSALYRAGGDTARADLPALPVQYLDYAVWQRRSQTPEWRAAQVAYWRDRLAGAPQALTLPTARRRLPGQGAAGGRVLARLSDEDAAALRRLCRAHDVTPFMAMAALLATVLRRWSGQVDLVLGVAVNTRRDARVESLIGLFVNTVPVWIDLAGGPTFRELLRRVRRSVLEDCVNHGQTQLDDIIRELRLVRDPLRTPLFQALLSMVDIAEGDAQLPGVTVASAQPPAPPGKVDLTLNVHRDGDEFRLELLYHAGRYDSPMMQAFLDQLVVLLAAVAADPDRDVAAYELPGPPAGAAAVPMVPDLAAAHRPSAADPDALVDWLRAHAVTAVQLAPPLLRAAAAAAGHGAALPQLRYAYLDNRGDLTAHDVDLIRGLAPACQVVGVYRDPATATPLAAYPVPAAWHAATAPLRVPIGAALAAPAAVRNAAGSPAATGEVGELWFGDARTGDHARWRPDGLLELAGPAGGRADPLEVTATLRDLPDVHDALVTGDTTWSAHVAGATVNLDRLRQHLVTRLPEDRIPRRVLVCQRFPLTADGDHDLAALPDPAGPHALPLAGGALEEELT